MHNINRNKPDLMNKDQIKRKYKLIVKEKV